MKLKHSSDCLCDSCVLKRIKYPSQKFAGAQVAEGENNDEELLQGEVGQEENRHLQFVN